MRSLSTAMEYWSKGTMKALFCEHEVGLINLKTSGDVGRGYARTTVFRLSGCICCIVHILSKGVAVFQFNLLSGIYILVFSRATLAQLAASWS